MHGNADRMGAVMYRDGCATVLQEKERLSGHHALGSVSEGADSLKASEGEKIL